MITRLKNVDGLNLQSLQRRIDNGYRFVIYHFSISLLIRNIYLSSPAYLVGEDNDKNYGKKYSLISLIFGWWSVPDGPTNTIKSIKINKQGGVDVTEDIMLNLNRDSLLSKKVKIEKLHTIFKSPAKSTIKDFMSSLNKTKGIDRNQKIYLGRYINTEDFSYFIVFEKISAIQILDFKKSLSKIFYEHVRIEISEIDENYEIHQKLIEQGIKI